MSKTMRKIGKVPYFYIVFKHDLKHSENNWRKTHFDSPIYEIMGYFDTRKEAQALLTIVASEIETYFSGPFSLFICKSATHDLGVYSSIKNNERE
jgi:hypothetical protein